MTLHYRNEKVNTLNDGYSQVLREASEYFESQRLPMIGSGFEEILSERALFDTYTGKLTEGLDANDAEVLTQLMENSRTSILQEAVTAGIAPIASLSMPTVRKMWPKIGLTNAIPTEAVKSPKFTISYMEPYVMDSDGNKDSIPSALKTDNDIAKLRALDDDEITIDEADNYDLFSLASGATVAEGDSIDAIFKIDTVTITTEDTVGSEEDEDVTVDVNIGLNINHGFHGEISADHPETEETTTDTIFGQVDLVNGKITATSLKGNIVSFTVDGKLTSENNKHAQSVSFDIQRKDVTIGTGAHLNAPLPIEWLQDTMALYQIDGALEVIDLMSRVRANQLDKKLDDFLADSHDRNSTYSASFNMKPSAGFAGRPKEWREELKTVIDYQAIKIKTETHYQGHFVIVGNPLDMHILPNVNWIFNHTTDDRGGVEVDYNIGAMSGSNRYTLVTSDNITAGTIKMFLVPSSPSLMTYKFYPYTFNVEKGYRDPNRPNVPSVMMTARNTVEELVPIICEITIQNNDGSVPNNIAAE